MFVAATSSGAWGGRGRGAHDVSQCLALGGTLDAPYSGDSDISIAVWNLPEDQEATVTRRLRGHTDCVRSISLLK